MTGDAAVTYVLEQSFRYTYAAPVRRLRHRLVTVPRAVHGRQLRLDHRVRVSGSPSRVTVTADGFGNHVVDVVAAEVAEEIEFESWAVVRAGGDRGETSISPAALADPLLVTPTPLTRADAPLAEAARALGSRRGGLALAELACSWTHAALAYEWGATTVRTTASEALAGGRGVCQDYAHVMLAVCRCAGLPARYVSGHLVGEGGSHAWVEVVVADPQRPGGALAVALDPTHDRRAGRGYLTVAVGRDYADVAPTSGTFDGEGPGRLSCRKRLSAADQLPV